MELIDCLKDSELYKNLEGDINAVPKKYMEDEKQHKRIRLDDIKNETT